MSLEDAFPPTGGGPPIFKFREPGDFVEGTIVRVTTQQARDMEGRLQTWPKTGDPKWVVIVTLKASDYRCTADPRTGDEEVEPDDEGLFRDFVQGQGLTDFNRSVKDAGDNIPREGAYYKRTFTHTEKTNRNFPMKVYTTEYGPAKGADESRELF